MNDAGKTVVPAAKRAVETALKRTIGMLGPHDVNTWESRSYGVKDLNALVQGGRADELPEYEL